ncbi:hypothetical protein JWG39_03860 [Desulforhopalus vacuolatus]|uniref:hypothetical protein n=1 Tax=Desulforhopalus vacuolatus TaxID=40414 RepID=UPI001962DFD9|nr:hypothetical protein [Desulforhopalus vacuolatus]MBM9518949.1 hypothetical protein [Desulforhopalus vacuolatus]
MKSWKKQKLLTSAIHCITENLNTKTRICQFFTFFTYFIIRHFREDLARAGKGEKLFLTFDGFVRDNGFAARKEEMIDVKHKFICEYEVAGTRKRYVDTFNFP